MTTAVLSPSRAFPRAASVAIPVAAGAAIGAGFGELAAAGVLLAIAIAVGIYDWRLSVYGLLAFLPVVGVFVVASFPSAELALISKDMLFVLPAYLGFLVYLVTRRASFAVPGLPMGLLALFGIVVIGQAVNPSVPSFLVAAIGTKVWIGYVPLVALGYYLVRSERDLVRLLAVVTTVAIVPATIGIVEAVAIAGGAGDRVYALYGDTAGAVTQNYAEFDYAGGGKLRRVPSTFPFVTQYYVFVSIMVALAYAFWRMAPTTRARSFARAAWLLLLVAAFLSGARGAFILIPLLTCGVVALDRGLARQSLVWLTPLAALGVAASVIGTSGAHLFTKAFETGRADFAFTFVGGVRDAVAAGWLGLGTGTVTNAARHAYGDSDSFTSTHGLLNESWYVKAQLELGIVGLALLVAILGATLATALRRHRRLRNPRFRAFSAAVIGLLLWNVAYAFKAQHVDIDPLNVYFWLLLGVLARVWTLDSSPETTR